MCFSLKASLYSWFFTLCMSFVLMYLSSRNKKKIIDTWHITFLLTFTQIQVIESLIWTDINVRNNMQFFTSLIYIFLWLQPLVNIIGITIYTYENYKNHRKFLWGYVPENFNVVFIVICFTLLSMYIIIFSFVVLSTITLTINNDNVFTTIINNNGNLSWKRCGYNMFLGNSMIPIQFRSYTDYILPIIYFFGLVIVPLLSFTLEGTILTIFSFGTFIFSISIYENLFGSFWCYIAVSYSIVYLIILICRLLISKIITIRRNNYLFI